MSAHGTPWVCNGMPWEFHGKPMGFRGPTWDIFVGAIRRVSTNNHTIIRAEFVCLFVCSLSPPRSFDGSSPNLVAVCRWTSHLPLRGSFSKRSMGRRVNWSLDIIYAPASRHTLQRRLLLGKQQNLIRRLLLCCMSTTYVGGPGNSY